MSYSREEIEEKRLLALQRKQQTQIKTNSPLDFTKRETNRPSPSILSDSSKSLNAINPFRDKQNKHFVHKEDFRNNSFKSNRKFNKQKERFDPIESKKFFGQKSCIKGTCYMINEERFAFETSSYLPTLIETLKTIPSRSYDVQTKTWNFHLKDYENLMKKIIQFKSEVQVIGLPKNVIQIFNKSNSSDKTDAKIDLSDIDPHLLNQLMPFQREGICYGISKGGRCMIADDMGLGKTIQALGIAHYYRENWPLLIVVPSSVRYQWADAIYTFLPSIPAHYILHFTSSKDFCSDSRIVITSYDLLVRAVDTFEHRSFGFVILDESHALKSFKTSRYKAAQRVISQARHVVLLTGTPALSRPIELYTQINLIMPKFMKYEEYGIRYCAGEKSSFGWDFTGSSNMQELQLLLKHTCLIRRLKSDVMNELPTKTREVVMLDPDLIKVGSAEMVEMSQKMERKVLTGIERHTALLQYYNESGIAKQKAICDYISKLLKDKHKFLVFAHHQSVLDAICNLIQSMNIKYIRIDGKTNPECRKFQVDKFQDCDDYLVAVLSITAANSGITLTAAQLVVFAELFWNPGVLCQAEDRVHRIGQNENVVIRYLVAKQTVDDYLWPLIQKKMNVLNEAGLNQDFSLHNINTMKHALNTKQTTLDIFKSNDQNHSKTDEEIVQSNESNQNVLLENNSSMALEEVDELLEGDFNFCDWDEME
ncbi:SWI/SNF-related matrix-associated actin-dependent regulator of chromatin subfamily A-like protein 1 [Hylaeus anthracinus]|uniref:SWI/SNF-related matrix-associated actin-dependent regulator of chromatin subfamily A-like protein 1 n=1 Tax=Hylaeus anthracinus TaxID=313031 RepID=UPI0023B91D18|nr:SWI/SNF-related matrix-associated actin-dependent regulator of chromatin subfamily A-like protein 1 [Hylaeus anthracinus]